MFQIHPLSAAQFAHLNTLDNNALLSSNIQVHVSDGSFPCRVSLSDAPEGERVFLLNFEHQPGDSPYRSCHAIYVRGNACEYHPDPGAVPDVLRKRLLSARAFNTDHEIVDAEVIEGNTVSGLIKTFFENPAVSYIHLHFARHGCFAASVTRAEAD